MEIHQAPEALQAFLRQRNLVVEGLTAHQTVETMIDWYRAEHVVDADSDMLLVQWGVYDWGSGPSFDYDVTRQMTSSATDGEGMWQIHITLHYVPSAEAVAVEADDRWCADHSEISEFLRFIEQAPGTKFAQAHQPERVELWFEDAG